MANQVFVNPYNQKPQVWSTQGAKLYVAGSQVNPILCLTGVQATLQRTISDQYPLGAGGVIRLVGAPTGQASFTSLLGPKVALKNFLDQLSNVCSPADVIIKPLQDMLCPDQLTKNVEITLIGCTTTQVGIQIQAAQQGMSMVNVPITVQFTNMQWKQ